MGEKEIFDLFVAADSVDGIKPHIERWIGRGPPINIVEVADLAVTAEKMSEGEGDLLACDAQWLFDNPMPNMSVIGALERRDPTLVIVGNDKLEYMPKKAIVIAELQLVKRQLLRARKDFQVFTSNEIAHKLGLDCPEQLVERLKWLNTLIEAGEIEGFITTRHHYSAAGIRTRRHTLGMQRKDPSRQRFVPPPWQGYTLILARKEFPLHLITDFLDEGNYRAFQLETLLVASIDENQKDFIGVNISQRNIAAILREMKEKSEQQLTHEILDIDGGIISGSPRMEVVLELVGIEGRSTVSFERIVPMEDATTLMIRKMLTNWNDLIEVAASKNPDHPRLGPSCPPFIVFSESEEEE